MRTLLKLLPILLVLAFGLVLIKPPRILKQEFAGGKHLTTLARLNNLRAAMSHMGDIVMGGRVAFPENIEELSALLAEEFDESFSDIEKSLTDGWGDTFRISGDMDDYSIRSAGPDRKFDTDDDIYLAGNWDGEHIIDGSRMKSLSAESLRKRPNRLPFREPTGYYQISLPGIYSVIRKYEGSRSEITFLYASNNYVRITAQPVSHDWIAEEEMARRVDVLQRGMDEDLVGFGIISSGPVYFNESDGYEIRLQKDDSLAREYGVSNNFYLAVSILVMASGKEKSQIMEILTNEVKTNLVIH